MNNELNLLSFRLDLLKEGKIGSTGSTILLDGEKNEQPEEMKTRTQWANAGRKVKEGCEGFKFKLWLMRKDGGFYRLRALLVQHPAKQPRR